MPFKIKSKDVMKLANKDKNSDLYVDKKKKTLLESDSRKDYEDNEKSKKYNALQSKDNKDRSEYSKGLFLNSKNSDEEFIKKQKNKETINHFNEETKIKRENSSGQEHANVDKDMNHSLYEEKPKRKINRKVKIGIFILIFLVLIRIVYNISIDRLDDDEISSYEENDYIEDVVEDDEDDLETNDYDNRSLVPNVIGSYIYEAESILNDENFTVGEISYEYSYQEEDIVISQSPAGDSLIDNNSEIDLIVSIGRDESESLNDYDLKQDEEEIKEYTNSSEMYRVIVDTFANRENAESQVLELRNLGFDATILSIGKDSGETFYRVLSGSYAVKENADDQLDKLRSYGYSPAITTTDSNSIN